MSGLLERMARNPVGDWTMREVEAACRPLGIRCSPPSGGGSHFKVSHPSRPEILTIPYRKPIKSVYIRKFVQFCRAVEASRDRS